jgi:hypothetical protein
MSILKVARMGHPALRERARPLDASRLRDPLLQKLIDDMIDTMHEYHGVGLAAPQVHEGVRLFVALLEEDPEPKSEALVLVNPEITPVGQVVDGDDDGQIRSGHGRVRTHGGGGGWTYHAHSRPSTTVTSSAHRPLSTRALARPPRMASSMEEYSHCP